MKFDRSSTVDVADSASGRAAQNGGQFNRRSLLIASGVAAAGAIGFPLVKRALAKSQPVFVARNQRYDGPLRQTIEDGLLATGINPDQVRGKRVLLKPNLVEPTQIVSATDDQSGCGGCRGGGFSQLGC